MPDHDIAILGASASGKTTFLGALSIAVTRRNDLLLRENRTDDLWSLIGVDQPSTEILVRLTRHLANRAFPDPTLGIEQFQWLLTGPQWHTEPRMLFNSWRIGTKRAKREATIRLNLADPAGGVSKDMAIGQATHVDRQVLLDKLRESQGIVFLFDPINEFNTGETFDHTFGILAELAQQMLRSNQLVNGRLPHYVSVCVSKFDEVKVLRTAHEANLLMVDPDDPFKFPRVDDDDARELFDHLCKVSRSGTADLAIGTIEQRFRPERIKYFVTSAIGFFMNTGTNQVDLADFQNSLSQDQAGARPGAGTTQRARIRGPVHPINVFEPLLWISERLSSDQAGARP